MFKSLASAAVAPGEWCAICLLEGVLTAHIATPPASPDDATKQALLAVVQVWLDRLSAMSVVVST